jgi:Ribonuclease G/E
MPIRDDLLKLIPVGEENAVSSRVLWRQIDRWAADSVRTQLGRMAAEGLIEVKIERQGEIAVKLYFRKK